MFIRKLCLLSGVLLYCFFPAGAQDLEPILSRDSTRSLKERIFEGKPFDIAGSLSLSLRSYSASGIENRQSPFSWFIAGQTNISIYKINIPFSALISAQSSNFNHPFNQSSLDRRFARIGMSPYYKWIKVHAGHRSMHLSPLTVANHVFLGGGVELTPGKIRFATFYGKMTKTEPRDLALNQPNLEIFRRTGGGLKIGYGDNQNFIDLIAFKAMDDPNQINPLNLDTSAVFREENLVLGLNGQALLAKRLRLNLEWSSSAFAGDAEAAVNFPSKFPHPGFLAQARQSTLFRNAMNTGIQYQLDNLTLGAGYKRIDPDFRSMGAYFFNNDLEHYTVNAGFGLFKRKIYINGSGGLQRNNLLKNKSTQLSRTIGALVATYTSGNISLNLNYSNYASNIEYVLNTNLDSLNAVVVTQQAGIQVGYLLPTKGKNRQMINGSINVQEVTDDLGDAAQSAASQMVTANVQYSFTPEEGGWRVRTRANYNRNRLSGMLFNRYGAGLGLQKDLLAKKLATQLDANYYNTRGDINAAQTLQLRLGLPYSINEHHRLDLSGWYLNRFQAGDNGRPPFSEFTGTLQYTFSF